MGDRLAESYPVEKALTASDGFLMTAAPPAGLKPSSCADKSVVPREENRPGSENTDGPTVLNRTREVYAAPPPTTKPLGLLRGDGVPAILER